MVVVVVDIRRPPRRRRPIAIANRELHRAHENAREEDRLTSRRLPRDAVAALRSAVRDAALLGRLTREAVALNQALGDPTQEKNTP